MSEIMEPTIDQQPGERLSWIKVWISVLTRPSVATFERILRDPQASTRRAYLWIFISAFIGVIILNVYWKLGVIPHLQLSTMVFSLILICTPFIALGEVLFLALVVWVTQWIARRIFGGSGTYASMIYAMAAIWAPLTIVAILISGIPYVKYLAYPLPIYTFVLGVMAIKAVNQISWKRAVISYLVFLILTLGNLAFRELRLLLK
jgi:hypothetical protein